MSVEPKCEPKESECYLMEGDQLRLFLPHQQQQTNSNWNNPPYEYIDLDNHSVIAKPTGFCENARATHEIF
jgi:hypothetical protein